MKIKPEKWWTWAIQTHNGDAWTLCCGKMRLTKQTAREELQKPSPEARLVQVVVRLAPKRKAGRA